MKAHPGDTFGECLRGAPLFLSNRTPCEGLCPDPCLGRHRQSCEMSHRYHRRNQRRPFMEKWATALLQQVNAVMTGPKTVASSAGIPAGACLSGMGSSTVVPITWSSGSPSGANKWFRKLAAGRFIQRPRLALQGGSQTVFSSLSGSQIQLGFSSGKAGEER